ncbi:MAG: tubulin binding cofactor A [Olpidium bornovanus]|uniref:Tubulin-specific chaperone A n=1 Tax=Olpidium bornovanus TaxID=278681 RepID=A0A8H8A103_9FUNG|nr:MAG: tubulin binding cofactor A [Olpidium bornovanus]
MAIEGQIPPAKAVRELKIKTGVVKRTLKEDASYEKEREQQQRRVDAAIAANADEYDIKKQKEVLEETIRMLPDVRRRLVAASNELLELLDKEEASLKDTEEFKAAKEVLTEAHSAIKAAQRC